MNPPKPILSYPYLGDPVKPHNPETRRTITLSFAEILWDQPPELSRLVELTRSIRGGAMFDDSFDHSRFRNDDGSETGATWFAAEDTDPVTLEVDTIYRVRVVIQEIGGASGSNTYQLQYNNTTQATGFTDVTTTSSHIRAVASADTSWTINDGDATTDQIGGTGGFVAGEMAEDGATNSATSFAASEHTEHEFVFQIQSADVADEDNIDLRVVNGMGQVLSGSHVPSITVNEVGGAATYDQDDFRFRPSDADPAINANAGGDWEAGIDVDASLEPDLLFRIRFGISTAIAAETEGFQIRSQKNGTGGYTLIPNNANPFVRSGDPQVEIMCIPGSYTDGAATTDLLNAAGSFRAGNGNDDNTTAAIAFLLNEHTEIEFCILIRKLSDTGHVADGDFFDFRIYKDDGTALDTYTVTPRVTIANRPGHVGGSWIETSGRNWTNDDDGNLYYLTEMADVPSTAARLEMLKSSDGGTTWVLMDTAGAPTYTDIEAVDMDYVAAQDTIHIVIQGPSDNVHYSTFRVAGHASPDTWNLDQLVTTTGTTEDQAVAIAHRDSENDTIVFYQGDQVSTRNQVNYKRLPDGGVWGTEQNLDSEASTDFMHPHLAKESDDTLHIFYHAANGTTGEYWHQTMSPASDTVDGTRTQVDQAITVDAGAPGSAAGTIIQPVIWDDGGTVRVGVIYFQDTGDLLYWNQSTVSTPSWGNEQQISAGQVRNNALLSRQVNAGMAIDDVDDEPWAFWCDDEVTDQFRLLSDTRVSGSWGTDTERNSNVVIMVRPIHFTHNSGNGGDRVMGFMINDLRDSGSPSNGDVPGGTWGETGFTRYQEIVLAAGGVGSLVIPNDPMKALIGR